MENPPRRPPPNQFPKGKARAAAFDSPPAPEEVATVSGERDEIESDDAIASGMGGIRPRLNLDTADNLYSALLPEGSGRNPGLNSRLSRGGIRDSTHYPDAALRKRGAQVTRFTSDTVAAEQCTTIMLRPSWMNRMHSTVLHACGMTNIYTWKRDMTDCMHEVNSLGIQRCLIENTR